MVLGKEDSYLETLGNPLLNTRVVYSPRFYMSSPLALSLAMMYEQRPLLSVKDKIFVSNEIPYHRCHRRHYRSNICPERF